jgi:hypothetical protein
VMQRNGHTRKGMADSLGTPGTADAADLRR